MANYTCAIRTNYFRVKDEDAFRNLMGRVCGDDDQVELWEETDKDGTHRFGFGCYGGITGVVSADYDPDADDDDDTNYYRFIDELQACVAEDDAIIILETGNEKLRYLVGTAEIITASDYKVCSLTEMARTTAAAMLGKPGKWTTKMDY